MQFPTLYNVDKSFLLFLNGSNCPFVDGLAITLTHWYWWIPFYIFLLRMVLKSSSANEYIALTLVSVLLCVALSGGIADWIIKPLVGRLRPNCNQELAGCIKVVNGYHVDGFSFFSAHAANTISLATFFTLLVKDKRLEICMFSWALVNCWTRLYLGVHYPSDVLAGILWGLICGIISYKIYRKLYKKVMINHINNDTASINTFYNPYDINMAIFILILSFIIAIIYNLI